jgi:hypothetical protein
MRIYSLIVAVAVFAGCTQTKQNNPSRLFNEKPAAMQQKPIITSGSYEEALNLAYNPETKQVTGYFEMERGIDVQFSCIYYIEGRLNGKLAHLKTYYPPTLEIPEISDDLIKGTLTMLPDNQIGLKLDSDHGGCNMTGAQSLKDSTVSFSLLESQPWVAIKFIKANKAYLYSANASSARLKKYLVKGDIVYIRKINGEWLYGTYKNSDGKATEGWLKASDTNKID